ncbi:MAG: 50S ribosomal protein L11 methyltransferase, partial [Lachnospiraceae bacterium]|nr:50S ribosomal protein L11 methyltransferase [Lachnospiraceae bacterium]
KVGETPYDVVVANILADIVIGLGSRIHTLLKEDGFLIASGIIDFKAEAVKEALSKEGFALVNEETLGEWVSMVFKKRRADV